jgi:hypothetical protein
VIDTPFLFQSVTVVRTGNASTLSSQTGDRELEIIFSVHISSQLLFSSTPIPRFTNFRYNEPCKMIHIFQFTNIIFRGSSVSIVSDYGLDGRAIEV